MSTKLPVSLPPGKTVRNIGGQNFLVSKRRGRSFKLPAKTRRKIAASARKVKIPVVTVAINAPPLLNFGQALFEPNVTMATRGVKVFNALTPYHGMSLGLSGGSPVFTGFDVRKMWATGANLVFGFVKRTGVLKPVNLALAKTKLPLRLS